VLHVDCRLDSDMSPQDAGDGSTGDSSALVLTATARVAKCDALERLLVSAKRVVVTLEVFLTTNLTSSLRPNLLPKSVHSKDLSWV
jgi:hypothetical protein